ncbi:hypothetical protein TorRG33x02_168940 [Trema orientale]|uniref:Uncharacterized protein n=1 Tax=Trema orientale TaxID=63057 RepID=A0A2P5ENV6_TREOI|nr:hypothetical protein TorRG33x02_168940 [Trema orientale]
MFLMAVFNLTIYRNATLGNGVSINFAHKGVNLNPNKRENRGQKHRPENNNGRRPVLAPHETLEEGIEMKNHPEGEEHLAEKWPPCLVTFVQCVREAGNDTNQVDDEECRWRDQECRPLDDVELPEL